MRRSGWTDREGPAIINCVGKGKAGPLNSVMRLPFIADDGQAGSNQLAQLGTGYLNAREQDILRRA
jgi:hypothetical protein